jgi:two-component system repressor protein LuxO
MSDSRGTILVVEGDPATVEMLSDYLARKRLGVARAHNLDEALAELESERPEAVVISLCLGESDGLDVVRRIREANVQVGLLVMAEPRSAPRSSRRLSPPCSGASAGKRPR